MKKQKLFAIALAGVTTMGTLAAGMPVMAEGQSGETTVNLTVEEVQGTYTLIVPSATTLDKDGKAVPLNGGITVYGENMKNSVVVTAKSKNNWALRLENDDSDSESTRMWYYLCNDEAGESYFEKMEFAADEVNANDGHGTTKNVYAVVEPNLEAKAGNYSDVITFTAEATGSGSGGGEIPVTPAEPDIKNCVRVTRDNIVELLEADSEGGETIYYDTEENAVARAKKLKKETGETQDVYVIYKFDQEAKKFYMVSSTDGQSASGAYNILEGACTGMVIYLVTNAE